MRNPRRTYLIAFAVALLVAFAARTFYYYRGFYNPPDVPPSEYSGIAVLADEFRAVASVGAEGRTVVIDTAHGNEFEQEELTVFTGRLSTNGGAVVFGDDLESDLHGADALVVIAPRDDYGADEQLAIQQFVDKGGRLVLIGDPTRGSVDSLNTLASGFGVIYQDDYLYTLTRGDGNFRNVILNDFSGGTPLTAGLDEVVFETAHSLRVSDVDGIILGDDEIYSSLNELPGGVIAGALTSDGQVLSLPDMTFLTSPYNTFADNDTLLDNIVTFALTAERGFDLRDFPFYFETPVQIVYQDALTLNNTFADMVALRSAMTENGIPANLVDVEEQDEGQPLVYFALYEQANEDVLALLEDRGVTVSDDPLSDDRDAPDSDGSIQVEGVARLERGGTVLFHLVGPEMAVDDGSSQEGDTAAADDTADQEEAGEENGEPPYQLIVLASGEEDLTTGIELLLAGDLGDCLVTSLTAVCVTGEVEIEPGGGEGEEPPPGESREILVISDDQALEGVDGGRTSADAIANGLDRLDHFADVFSLSDSGAPSLGDLAAYDLVFWSIGDYCCTAPDDEAVQVLMEYLDVGGLLVIDGVFIATDWGGSEFLNDYLGAEFLDFGLQVDVAVADFDHPVAEGLDDVIPFEIDEDIGPPQPDVIGPLGDADVVLERGPDSEAAGEASLLAFEREDGRVIYAAFSLYQLPEDMLIQLLDNMVRWLTS